MTDFICLTFWLLLLCAAGKLMAGKISRRMQYALWLWILVYLPVSRFIRLPSPAERVETVSPWLAHQMVKLEVQTIGAVKAIVAMALETSAAGGICVGTAFFRFLRTLRYGVTIVLVIVFGIYNAGFMARCIKRRRYYKTDTRTGMKLYILDYPQTPFLLGKSIYVHPDMTQNETFLQHAVCHEYAHYKQGDFFWMPLQFLFLAYYWFHPVVWMAVSRMRQDSELSSDERVISLLGEDCRRAYGESLILLLKSRQRKVIFDAAAMMSGKKKQLKERITAIAKKQRRNAVAVGIVAACLILMAGHVLWNVLHVGKKDEAAAVFCWDGTGVEREEIEKAVLYHFVENVSYPPIDVTEEILSGQEIPLAGQGRYMIIVTTKDGRRVDISDCGTDKEAGNQGLLPSRVINLGGDNR